MRARHESFGIRHVARFAPRLSQGHEAKASCANALVYSRDVTVKLGTVPEATIDEDGSGGHL